MSALRLIKSLPVAMERPQAVALRLSVKVPGVGWQLACESAPDAEWAALVWPWLTETLRTGLRVDQLDAHGHLIDSREVSLAAVGRVFGLPVAARVRPATVGRPNAHTDTSFG